MNEDDEIDSVEETMVTETEKHFYRLLRDIARLTDGTTKINRSLIHTLARSGIDHYIIATMASRAGKIT